MRWHVKKIMLALQAGIGYSFLRGGQSIMEQPIGKQSEYAARASKGGAARMKKLSHAERQSLAREAAKARWGKRKAGIQVAGENSGYSPIVLANKSQRDIEIPIAKWPGVLSIGTKEIPCYVLADGRRIISRNAATGVLTDEKGGGNLEQYLVVQSLRGYVPPGFTDQMIEFFVPGTSAPNTTTKGISAEAFIEICQAYVSAFEAGALTTERQKEIAVKAAMFMAACAKVGLIAMIDEATGYQYERASDALQIKLKLFLAEEMRKWEKTFPDQLWEQFGRLTKWTGSIHSRPKYWGNLVMELIYEYLDADVAQWLRVNAPRPLKGQNYHQWMTEQYGLKKLIEHIWKVIGIASTCEDMKELKRRMEELYGSKPGFQFELKLKAGNA
jgi:hypothetical protein